ncbi:GntR family transcriptional regulator [Terrabacter aerolatus]|uniref:GntR family transcriptional regulator n=1 Tax=Terrabacter aerolatus TaxID=422442 RepID=A0A512CZI8_9MICO|nr:GntR family transcriptional regulator [Terrabacter aerolatus]GEO29420.1 GntR family transcriptional regulator [Terrabacter aerolatus]
MGNMLLMVRLSLPHGAPSLADAVVEAVRAGVTAGELLPGETYSVYQLAELLEVSRSPVREALLRLAEAGLVQIDRNRGFRVVLPQAHDIEEIFDIRLALEPAAARRAAEQATDDEHAAIRAAFEALSASIGDEDRFWRADQHLHDRLVRAGGNHRAAAIIERLRATTALLGPPTTTAGRTLAEIRDEHEPIVSAVLGRRGDDAESAMRDHLQHTGGLLAQVLQGPSSDPPGVSQSAHRHAAAAG